MIIKLCWIFLLIIFSGIAYNLGGSAKLGNWLDFLRNSKTRDLGCSLLSLVAVGLLRGFGATWWAYGIVFGLSWAALSTYWDWLTKLWRKTEDEYWENWLLHGFFIGLAFIPLIWFGFSWWIILVRALLLGLTMMLVSVRTKNVYIEEFGRGSLIILTELLFLIK